MMKTDSLMLRLLRLLPAFYELNKSQHCTNINQASLENYIVFHISIGGGVRSVKVFSKHNETAIKKPSTATSGTIIFYFNSLCEMTSYPRRLSELTPIKYGSDEDTDPNIW